MYKNNTQPLISIVMPVYNASEYLVGALDSILNQTYKNWELIAIDDCSTDSSHIILSQYAQLDDRIRVYKNTENIGVGSTLDRGIGYAQGEFIARMDADDISFPDRFAKQIEFLTNNPDVIAVGGQCLLIDENGKYIGVKNFPTNSDTLYDMLYSNVPIQHPSLMVNRSLVPANFTWYDGWRKAQDLYLFFKLVNYGKLSNLRDYVLKYRYYRGGNSLKDPKDTFKLTNQIRYIAKTKFGYTPSLKARVVNLIQLMLVTVLPNAVIFYLFKFVRGLMKMYNFTNGEYSKITSPNYVPTEALAIYK